MQYTVYVDVLFLVNWIMDFLLLNIAAKLMGCKRIKKNWHSPLLSAVSGCA